MVSDPQSYFRHFRDKVLPQLGSSQIFLSFAAPGDEFDVQQACQLGAAILLGKPLVVAVPPGRRISPQLERAADAVLWDFDATDTDAATARLKATIAVLLEGEAC